MTNEDPGVEHIPLHPPGRAAYIFLLIVLIGFIGFLVIFYVRSPDGLVAARGVELIRGLLITAAVSLTAMAFMLWALRRRELFLTARELVFRGGFFSRTIPLSTLVLSKARQLSLFEQMEFAPRWRTNGIRLPGYRAGWFSLRNGDKALIYLTDPLRITYLPTTRGFALLLSTDALIPALERRANVAAAAAAAVATAAAGAGAADRLTLREPGASGTS